MVYLWTTSDGWVENSNKEYNQTENRLRIVASDHWSKLTHLSDKVDLLVGWGVSSSVDVPFRILAIEGLHALSGLEAIADQVK